MRRQSLTGIATPKILEFAPLAGSSIKTKFNVKQRVKFYYRNFKDEPLLGEIYEINIAVDPAGLVETSYTIWADKKIKSSHKHSHHESEIEKA